MPYPPRSPAWCFRCGRDPEDDGVRLVACYLARPFTRADGRRSTRTIPIRVCTDCARLAIEASARSSGRIRADLLERSRPRAPRARTAAGTYATRAQMAAAELTEA